ncbi:RNA polymerase sigma-70 factor [Maribellus sp. CM-23]|uniref:RNA polymerase sigma-70 factor n=1 Tax=Maribellus luteus TaxID=2305463 RepID=A0A399T6R8_9BACT|nr:MULTISPECIES: RNA polymerase sigma-70 factor [Maribellus]MCE4564645.1 RNA polymerase sigma-70 factor [Maribellus sp. CM-23]RIJ50565.1 RNA polymerase sigma-70 factor [Maribellus luteus]
MWFFSLYSPRNKKGISATEFHQLFREIYPDLCVYVSRYLNDEETAKDIVQDVLITFWEESEKLKDKKLIRPYLFKSVKHRALNHLKRESRKLPLDAFFDSFNETLANNENESVESFLALENLQSDLEKAINELPEQRQRIFRMSRFEEMKHKEIAAALDISPKTVETQIFRALKFIRDKLGGE